MTRPRLLAREVRRTRAILSVFARHGLGDLVAHLHLPSRWAARAAPDAPRAAAATRAARVRQALEELGPTFIKFGQALSIRSDLLPAALVAELTRLQDAAPPLPPGTAERVIEEELGAPASTVFRVFDATPIGSASIAQVHRATLPDGTPVAVKVRRPGIHDVIEGDLAVLHAIAAAAERHWADAELFAPSELVRQFARSIRLEQDFTREGRVIERFAGNFRGNPTIIVPRVHWSHTRRAVLTLDYVDGVKVSDDAGLRLQGSDPPLVARRGADAILQQVLVDGLFHADPHPGNILVLPGSVICLLDFGIVGHMSGRTRDRVARLIQAVGHRDVPRVVRLVLALGQPLIEPDVTALEQDATELVEAYAGARLQDLSIRQVWDDIADVVGRHRIKLPADLMLLVKTLVTMEGVGVRLDPGFRMIEYATPYVRRVLLERWSPGRALARVGRNGREIVEAIETMPQDLHEILARGRAGTLAMHVRQDDLERVARAMDIASRRISASVLSAALILGLALVIGAGRLGGAQAAVAAAAVVACTVALLGWAGFRNRASAARRPPP